MQMMMIANYGTVMNEYNTRGLFTPYYYGPIGFMHMYKHTYSHVHPSVEQPEHRKLAHEL